MGSSKLLRMKIAHFFKNCDILSVSMLIGAAAAILTAGFAGFARECEKLPDEVLRLHILANSDSAEDQHLKYGLRDFLISDLSGIFYGAENLEQACLLAENNLELIRESAEQYIGQNGSTYKIRAEITEMYFTTRVYGNSPSTLITMPAGNYKALRIIIGEGGGQNWWCVMFPPLCLPAVSVKSGNSVFSEPYFSKEASKSIESGKNNTSFRFAIYEWLESLFKK